MARSIRGTNITYSEILFQIGLHLLVFSFYSFDKDNPQITSQQIIFFLNYAVAAFIINYVLLPRFFYRKQYFAFFLFVALIMAGVIIMEELVLEKIYFPDTRGRSFPGVFYSLLETLPVITILSGFKFAWDAIGKQREVDELKAAVKESELQFLKSQINPHFLFNNLNNLYSYAIENSPKTPEIILELSSVLRYMLYECREAYVMLSKEIEQLHNFVKLSELQIEERGTVRFHAEPYSGSYRIAPLILIVFVENAFKHSTASQASNIEIDIHIQLSDAGELTFVCKNSYLPQSNQDHVSHGIGIENVKKRLELIYPDDHQLQIEQRETEYIVELRCQLERTTREWE